MKDLHYVCFTPNLAYIPHLERCVKGLLKRVGRPDQIQLVFLMHQEVTKKHREPLLEMIESFGAPAPIVKYPELELELDFRTEDGNNVLTTDLRRLSTDCFCRRCCRRRTSACISISISHVIESPFLWALQIFSLKFLPHAQIYRII